VKQETSLKQAASRTLLVSHMALFFDPEDGEDMFL
jgi:hypothetical protein